MMNASELSQLRDVVADMWNNSAETRIDALNQIIDEVRQFCGDDTAFNAFWRTFNPDASYTNQARALQRLSDKLRDITE